MRNTHQRLARNAKPTIKTEQPDHMFDMKSLREELQHLDPRRRKTARTAMYWLARLASYRAAATHNTRKAAWKDIFDTKRLQTDLQGPDEQLQHVAYRVLTAVSGVIALREIMDSVEPTSIGLKLRAITLFILAREKVNQALRNNGEPEFAYTLN